MAKKLDLNALKKKLKETQDKQNGGGDFNFWNPDDGRNVVRLFPMDSEDTNTFYKEVIVHYQVGPNKKMVVCSKMEEDSCPVCDDVEELRESDDKSDQKLGKRMKARSRYYLIIEDKSLKKKDEGYGNLFIYGCGVTVFEGVLTLVLDPDYQEEIIDPDDGYDLVIHKSGTGLNTEYKVTSRPKKSSTNVKNWEDNMPDISPLVKAPTYDALAEFIETGEWPESDENDSNEEEEKEQKAKRKKKKSTKKSSDKKKKKKPEPEPEEEEEEDDDDGESEEGEEAEDGYEEDEIEDEEDEGEEGEDENESEEDDGEEEEDGDEDDVEDEIQAVLNKKKKGNKKKKK